MSYEFDKWKKSEYNYTLGEEKELRRELECIIKNAPQKTVQKGAFLYRARVRDKPINVDNDFGSKNGPFFGFTKELCGAPPIETTVAGRFNYCGNPILYLASDKYTAVTEVKGSKRTTISVARMKALCDLKLIDMSGIIETEYEDVLNDLKKILRFPEAIGNLKMTRFFSQLVKASDREFQGILYESSIASDGLNYAIFDVDSFEAVSSDHLQIHNIFYDVIDMRKERNDIGKIIYPVYFDEQKIELTKNWLMALRLSTPVKRCLPTGKRKRKRFNRLL